MSLCGHATLATGYVILNHLMPGTEEVSFETLSGALRVRRDGDGLAMDFPALPAGQSIPATAALISAIGAMPLDCFPIRELHGAPYLLLVYETEAQIAEMSVTAPGDNVDFVSRFFAPMAGIDEDPVTGSAHCTLAPYWADRLGKDELTARQISARGGDVGCRIDGDRVVLSGHCAFYMEGRIEVPG